MSAVEPSAVAASTERRESVDGAKPATQVRGLDVLHLYGNRTIRQWVPDFLQPVGSRRQQPAATDLEAAAAMAMMLHPATRSIRRADASAEFVAAQRLPYENYEPIGVPYMWEGTEHTYWIDWLIERVGLPGLLLEAGVWDAKAKAEGRVKAAAARRWAADHGFVYAIATDLDLPMVYRMNLRELVAVLADHEPDPGMARAIHEHFDGPRAVFMRTAIERAGGDPANGEWLNAAYWVVGRAHKDGRLLLDLRETRLTLETPIHLAPEGLAPICYDSYPDDLEDAVKPALPEIERPVEPWFAEDGIHRETVDPTALAPADRRRFYVLARAMERLDGHEPMARVARDVAMAGIGVNREGLRYLRDRYLRFGPKALLKRVTYPKAASKIPEFYRTAIAALYVRADRPMWTKIHRELVDAQKQHQAETGDFVVRPTVYLIKEYCRGVLDKDLETRQARSGEVHPSPPRKTLGFQRTVLAPGRVLQIDAWKMNVMLVAADGSDVTYRCTCVALIDVFEQVPVAAMLMPTDPVTEDILRLVQFAMQDKTTFARSMGCENPWDVACKPVEVVTDNASIMANEALAEAFGRISIHLLFAPRFDGPYKGIVEGWFAEVAKLFADNMPSTTLGSPERRGAHDAERAAVRAAITFTQFRALFFQFVVDHYLQRPTERKTNRYIAWKEAAEKLGVHQARWTSDDLKMLLLRRENPKGPDGLYEIHDDGLNLFGFWYRPTEGIVEDYRPGRVEIWFDRWDLTFIYPRVRTGTGTGYFLGPWMTLAYGGARVGYDERLAWQNRDQAIRKAAEAIAENRLLEILAAARSKKERRDIARAHAKMVFRDEMLPQVHPHEALAARARFFASDPTAEPIKLRVVQQPAEDLPDDLTIERPLVWGTDDLGWRRA